MTAQQRNEFAERILKEALEERDRILAPIRAQLDQVEAVIAAAGGEIVLLGESAPPAPGPQPAARGPAKPVERYRKGKDDDRVLAYLKKHGPTLRYKVAEDLKINKSSVFRIDQRLVDFGMVERTYIDPPTSGGNRLVVWSLPGQEAAPEPEPDDAGDARYEQPEPEPVVEPPVPHVATRAQIMQILEDAGQPITSRQVLERVRERYPQVTTLGEALRDAIRQGKIDKITDEDDKPMTGDDGFPLVMKGTGQRRPASQAPAHERSRAPSSGLGGQKVPPELAEMPAVAGKQFAKSNQIDSAEKQKVAWDWILSFGGPFISNDVVAGTDLASNRVGDYIKQFKDAGMLEPTGVSRRNVERDGPGKPSEELRVVSGRGALVEQPEPDVEPERPAEESQPDEEAPAPHERATTAASARAAGAFAERAAAIRAHIEEEGPISRRDLASDLNIPPGSWGTVEKRLLEMYPDITKYMKEVEGAARPLVFYLVPGQTDPAAHPTADEEADVGGEPADQEQYGGDQEEVAVEDTFRGDTGAGVLATAEPTMEQVRDVFTQLDGMRFSPAQLNMFANEQADEEVMWDLGLMKERLDQWVKRGSLKDVSPSEDLALYLYEAPREPGRAAELDMARGGGDGDGGGGSMPVAGTGRGLTIKHPDVRKLVSELQAAGCTVTHAGSGHLQVLTPSGRKVMIANTPSRASTVENDRTRLRRAGVRV